MTSLIRESSLLNGFVETGLTQLHSYCFKVADYFLIFNGFKKKLLDFELTSWFKINLSNKKGFEQTHGFKLISKWFKLIKLK